jgi:hypothetical protein
MFLINEAIFVLDQECNLEFNIALGFVASFWANLELEDHLLHQWLDL